MAYLTTNERNHGDLFAAARKAGAETGAKVRETGWVKADAIIARAAVGYVARLPLNNIKLERELQGAYVIAAEKSATTPAPLAACGEGL